MEELRISVRTLVEFTLHGADITPGGSLRDLQEGMLGHKARQALLGDGWRAEVPVETAVPVEEEELTLRVTGRMDAFAEGVPCCVEEIKLWQGREAPADFDPAHKAQAVCYGHMLCERDGLNEVDIRVVYVTRSGAERGVFAWRMTAEECREVFEELVENYVRRLKLVRAHRRARNASLRDLAFPFVAYRPGQREMAVQVYTAIRTGRRLFASMPTGTGKTAAVLFPALKALGQELTGQLYCLTARTTQRASALETLRLAREGHACLWTLTLDAKEKQCPAPTLCHPEHCPRAKGHFLRDGEAIEDMLRTEEWSPEAIQAMADKHQLCPFEFSLSLAEIADVTVCDYNYALHPAVHIRRIFDHPRDVTLLIDEAHNLPDRLRDMLAGRVDGGAIRRLRTAAGKQLGKKHSLYQAMTRLLRELDDLPLPEGEADGLRLPESQRPGGLLAACQEVADGFLAARQERPGWQGEERLTDVIGDLLAFIRASERAEAPCVYLAEGRKTRTVTAYVGDVSGYFAEATARLQGTVCYSATLQPLPDMKRLLGGDEEDACFAMPSPFPRENLLVLRCEADTRYRSRAASSPAVAEAIEAMVRAREGRYIAFFPSFAYLELVAEQLTVPFQSQGRSMTGAEREAFLAPYRKAKEPCLSLCVLGGLFAEGIDLPGRALDGVAVVGVGLPQVSLQTETLRAQLDAAFGDGFLYAYQIPGMHKVTQAVGRVIRSGEDRGVALLIDTRYAQQSYRRLCPEHWMWKTGDIGEQLRLFWEADGTEQP